MAQCLQAKGTLSNPQRRALQALDQLIDGLGAGLRAGDAGAGWGEELRRHWLTWVSNLRAEVEAGKKPGVNLYVALDHNGIRGKGDPEHTPLSWLAMQAADALYAWQEA